MAVAAALAVGCGGEDDAATKRDVRATVHEFARNIAERDYEHVCRLVTKKVRADWADFARRNPKRFSTSGCPAFAEDFYGGASVDRRTLRKDMEAIDRASVQVKGDRATLTPHGSERRAGVDDTTVLRKVDGHWLLDD